MDFSAQDPSSRIESLLRKIIRSMEDCIELFRITELQDAELRAPVDDLQSGNVDFVRSSQVVSVIHALKREIAGIIEAFR